MGKSERPEFWFYAKRYGYGWGLPARWEGWVVLFGYIGLVLGSVLALPLHFSMAFLVGLTMALIAICYWKGETARWRWGEDNQATTQPNLSSRGLLLLHLLFGPLLLGLALYFYTYPPTEINGAYGHRTEASMRSQASWDEAQSFSSKALIVAAIVTIIYQVASCFLMKPIVSLISSCLVLAFASMICIPLTEFHLEKHFDEQGQRIVAPQAEQHQ